MKKRQNLIVLSIVAGVIIVAVVIVKLLNYSGGNTPAYVQTPMAPQSSDASDTSNAASNTPPPPATRQVEGTAVTLGAGMFTGGQDVAVGLYNVTTTAGQSGNFIVTGTDNYDEILGGGDVSLGDVPEIRVQISKGDQIQISGMSSVTFTPVTTPFVTTHALTNLYDGTFTVGQDIGTGRYVVTPGTGQSGNFIVSGNDTYNEILGSDSTDGDVPSVTVSLTDGDQIQISSMSQVTFTPTN